MVVVMMAHHVMMVVMMPHHVVMAVMHHVMAFRRVGDRLHLRSGDPGGQQDRGQGGDGQRSEFHGRLLLGGLIGGPLIRQLESSSLD
jgi:hypothetical protein